MQICFLNYLQIAPDVKESNDAVKAKKVTISNYKQLPAAYI